MRGHRYTEEQAEFIVKNTPGTRNRELTRMFNKQFGLSISEIAIRSYKKSHGLKSGLSRGKDKDKPTALYPAEIRQFIAENHKGTGPVKMAELLNSRFGTSYTKGSDKSILWQS